RVVNDADALVHCTAEEYVLKRCSEAGGEGEAGDAPARIDTQQMRQRDRAKPAEHECEGNANDGEVERGPRVAECVEGRRVKATGGAPEQADARAGESAPDVNDVARVEVAGAIDGGDDDIAEDDEGDGRGNDEPSDLLQAGGETRAELGGDLLRGAEGGGHGGQL